MLPNIITSISGLPKTGKTHLSFTWPAPIKCFSFDVGADFVRTKFPDKEIEVQNFALPVVESGEETWALPIWEDFYSSFREAVESDKYRTLILDTATAVEATLRQAILEELQVERPNKKKLAVNEYVARNLRMAALFTRARNNGVNLITIQYLTPEWVRQPGSDRAEPTGKLVISGWNQTEGLADVNIEMSTKEKAGKTVMVTTIKSNRFERAFNGQALEDTTYDEIVALLLGG
jgi:hypothetical protein